MSDALEPRERLDKWLWHARFFRTRAAAAEAARLGKVRVNGARALKAGVFIRQGDVLTIGRAGRVFVVSVIGFAPRRGSAADASALYEMIEAPASSIEDDSG